MLSGVKKGTKKIAVVALVLNICAGIAYGMFYMSVGEIRAEVAKTAQTLQQKLVLQEIEQSERHVISDTKQKREKLQSYFITEEEAVSFIEQLETLSTVAGVSLSISSVDVKKEGLSVQLNTESAWTETYHFLTLVESMPLKVSIDQARFRYNGNGVWNTSYTVLLESFLKDA